jgi:uncharacterized protein
MSRVVGASGGAGHENGVAASPLAAGERLVALDVVRGFALLGILLMNVEFFLRPVQALVLGREQWPQAVDRAAGWLVAAFVQGKFYILFALLFGMGFAIQLERWGRDGGPFAGRFLRRMAGLAAIGLLHATLIWYGDILFSYALIGVALLAFRRTPVRRLPAWGLALVVVPLLVGTALRWQTGRSAERATGGGPAAQARAEYLAGVRAGAAEAERVYRSGTPAEIQVQRVEDARLQFGFFPFFAPGVLGIFLLGAWFVRAGVVADPEAHAALLRRLTRTGLALGAPLAVAAMHLGADAGQADVSPHALGGHVVMQAASLLLGLAYFAGLLRIARRPGWVSRLAPVAAAGRMALSNYLLQSILVTALAYGWGLGLYGRVPRATQLLLALAVWGVNLAVSHWWLARFRFGPAEWLWRSITYGRLTPAR